MDASPSDWRLDRQQKDFFGSPFVVYQALIRCENRTGSIGGASQWPRLRLTRALKRKSVLERERIFCLYYSSFIIH